MRNVEIRYIKYLDHTPDQDLDPLHAVGAPGHTIVVLGLEIDDLVLVVVPVLDLLHVPEIWKIVDLVQIHALMIAAIVGDVNPLPVEDPLPDQDQNLDHRKRKSLFLADDNLYCFSVQFYIWFICSVLYRKKEARDVNGDTSN